MVKKQESITSSYTMKNDSSQFLVIMSFKRAKKKLSLFFQFTLIKKIDPNSKLGYLYWIASYGVWQRSFIPTNDLILTRPAIYQCNDGELSDMVKRFETSAANAAAMEAPLQCQGQRPEQTGMPSRRSFLRPTPRPVSTSKSDYPPPHGCKTWRKFPDTPDQEEIVNISSSDN